MATKDDTAHTSAGNGMGKAIMINKRVGTTEKIYSPVSPTSGAREPTSATVRNTETVNFLLVPCIRHPVQGARLYPTCPSGIYPSKSPKLPQGHQREPFT